MTTVKRDDDIQNIYTVPVGRCNEHSSYDESKYEEKRKNALIGPGESISKKEPSKISENKAIVPGAPTILYKQGKLEFL